MIWWIFTIVFIIYIWKVLSKPLNYWSDRGVKQTKPWLLLGDTWVTLLKRKSFSEFTQWLYNMHPNTRYAGCYQFYMPTLVLRDPELTKQITVRDFDHFTDHRTFVDPDGDPLWARNLFSLKGQRWREMRATLSGSFSSSKMKIMFNLMNEAADNFVQYFLAEKDSLIELEMKDAYTRYTNDVIATTAFGIKVDSLIEPQNTFYLMGRRITNFSGFLTSLKFLGYLLIPTLYKKLKISILDKTASDFFRKIINETIWTREEKGIIRPDMINMLIDAKHGIQQDYHSTIPENSDVTTQKSNNISKYHQFKTLTNDDITSQAVIFFFGGFDTISTAMCFGSYELAINKDIQNKLRDEIKKTFQECNGKITYDVLLKLKYLDMVVSEILRKWPPVSRTDRVCTKPYIIESKLPGEPSLYIDSGITISIPIMGFHRDPLYYPDPEKFNPERFAHADKIMESTYFPFGCGPRKCIASRFALIELKALLFKLVLHFEIVPSSNLKQPIQLAKDSFTPTIKGGFRLILKKLPH